ncbi:phosphotransferase family protein [Bacillus sp. CGMCC 1.16607]|uniref:phosphotransferase family protein n=1 Tax=Bacillus sp. CGMCC 1.16607 TaxID=3351842 RepID=UPI003631E51F
MVVDNILNKLGISSYTSFEEIIGGRDSSVFKIHGNNRDSYALRILPRQGYHQFEREEKVIRLAKENGIPVPIVHSIVEFEDKAAMLMDWAEGQTVLNMLQKRPESALKLGLEFGQMQASINKINVSHREQYGNKSWLSPSTNELELYNQITRINETHQLLHLDYHPLNVLTDGEKITAVIDWANASIGDTRFDIARTFSILRLEGVKLFREEPNILSEFEKGWLEGYEKVSGQIDSLPLFYAWAGTRMKRDMASTLLADDKHKIDEWVTDWLSKS